MGVLVYSLLALPTRHQPRRGAPPKVRRVRGCLVGNRGADQPPQEAPLGTSSGALAGSRASRPRGCLSAPASGDLCPAVSCGLPPGSDPAGLTPWLGHVPVGGRRLHRITEASATTVPASLLD